MTQYLLLFKGPDGQFESQVELACEGDEAAIRTVRQRPHRCGVELWQGPRCIETFPADSREW